MPIHILQKVLGVYGKSNINVGVVGESNNNFGVYDHVMPPIVSQSNDPKT